MYMVSGFKGSTSFDIYPITKLTTTNNNNKDL